MTPRPAAVRDPLYPDWDGQPVADNTRQFRWISDVYSNLARLFAARPDVFVAGNNLIYPVEGEPKARLAPDVYVAFGRPKGDRGSYKVWLEGGVFPQVVWEVLSPRNSRREMAKKRADYERYGALEYFVIDPKRVRAEVWVRRGDELVQVPADGFVSPLLGTQLFRGPAEWQLTLPDGSPFETLAEAADRAAAERAKADALKRQAEAERVRAEAERVRAEAERERAEAERERAAALQALADSHDAARAQAEAEAARFRALLKAAGVDPDARS